MDTRRYLTYHHSRFDAGWIAAEKRRQRVIVSLVIPTLNETETIGGVVAAMRGDVFDEILVVDGGSTDGTMKAAREAGATTYLASAYTTDHGKGANMLVGLLRSHGDIVAFCDADYPEPDTRLAYATVGALLENDNLDFAKGYYGEHVGTGRITEQTVRPLLRTHYPHLADCPGPLSGEIAGHRQFLSRLHFPADYGVDIRLLLDATEQGTVGWVDLDSRWHRYVDDGPALSKAATEITAAILTARGVQCGVR